MLRMGLDPHGGKKHVGCGLEWVSKRLEGKRSRFLISAGDILASSSQDWIPSGKREMGPAMIGLPPDMLAAGIARPVKSYRRFM